MRNNGAGVVESVARILDEFLIEKNIFAPLVAQLKKLRCIELSFGLNDPKELNSILKYVGTGNSDKGKMMEVGAVGGDENNNSEDYEGNCNFKNLVVLHRNHSSLVGN